MSAFLRLLGPPALVEGDTVRPLPPGKPLWLAAYLAARGDAVGREPLAALFWPDEAPEAARNNLRQLLSRAARQPGLAGLEADRTSVRFTGDSDLARVRDAAARGRWADVLAAHGGTLLDGFESTPGASGAPEYAAWLDFERETWRARWCDAARREAAARLQGGRAGAALALLEDLLSREPLDEDALCALLDAARLAGERERGRAAYTRFERALHADLGLAPHAATRRRLEALHEEAGPAGGPVSRDLPPLPRPLTALLGRGPELERLAAWSGDPHRRLLTVVGLGGIGKTRLAQEWASRLAERAPVGWVALETLPPDQDPLPAVLAALGLRAPAGGDLARAFDRIDGDEVWLVLDNAEHLLDALRPAVRALLDVPRLRVLVTSRERLALPGEHALPLSGLPIGAADDSPAARLLLDTAHRANPDLRPGDGDAEAVARICARLEGSPLGLELAGAWARVLGLREIADELDADLAFLEGAWPGLPERQRSLRAVYLHSRRRLTPAQQRALAACALFRGGFTREAARDVAFASARDLLGLCDAGLVRAARSREPRFELHPLVREFALEELDAAPDRPGVGDRLVAHFAARAALHVRHLDPLRAEYDNLAAAWTELLRARDWAAMPPILAVLGRSSFELGRYREGLALIDGALALGPPDAGRGHLLAWRGNLCSEGGRLDEARRAFDAAAPLLEGTASLGVRAMVAVGRGILSREQGDPAAARRFYEEALRLFRALEYDSMIAVTLNNLALVANDLGDPPGALAYLEQTVEIEERLERWGGLVITLYNLGEMAIGLGDLDLAERSFARSAALAPGLGRPKLDAIARQGQGLLRAARGDLAGATAHLDAARAGFEALGDVWATAYTLRQLADAHLRAASLAAGGYAREAIRLALRIEAWPLVAESLLVLVRDRGDATLARRLVSALENDLPHATETLEGARASATSASGPPDGEVRLRGLAEAELAGAG